MRRDEAVFGRVQAAAPQRGLLADRAGIGVLFVQPGLSLIHISLAFLGVAVPAKLRHAPRPKAPKKTGRWLRRKKRAAAPAADAPQETAPPAVDLPLEDDDEDDDI